MKGQGLPLVYGVPNNVTTTATRNHNSTLQLHLQPRTIYSKSKEEPTSKISEGLLVAESFSFVAERNAREKIGLAR